jgi:hypothetical protein
MNRHGRRQENVVRDGTNRMEGEFRKLRDALNNLKKDLSEDYWGARSGSCDSRSMHRGMVALLMQRLRIPAAANPKATPTESVCAACASMIILPVAMPWCRQKTISCCRDCAAVYYSADV